MTWWKILWFVAGITVLIVGVQDMSWWKIIIGIVLLFLGVIAK